MDLVEQHGGDPAKLGVCLKPRQIDTMRHGDDPRRPADLGVEASGVADRRSGILSTLPGHIFGRAAGGEPPRDQQKYLAPIHPRFVQQRRGDARGLACPGWRDEQGARTLAQSLQQLRHDGIDG
jgi:hypothetical protein